MVRDGKSGSIKGVAVAAECGYHSWFVPRVV